MLILVYNIEGQEFEYRLADGCYVMGRSRKCDIVARDQSISGQHIRFDVSDGKVLFRDLKSSNGTKLNGKKVDDGELNQGDKLLLGRIKINVRSDAPVASERAASPAPAPAVSEAHTPDVPLDSGVPLDFSAPPPSEHAEETPFDEGFVDQGTPAHDAQLPAVARPAAVSVIPAGGENLPSVVPSGAGAGGNKNKKMIMHIAIGVLAVVAIGVFMMPVSDSGAKQKTGSKKLTRKSYWSAVEKGVEAFRDARYSVAFQLWDKADRKWSEDNPDTPLQAASAFARFAKPYDMAAKGELVEVDWMRLNTAAIDLLDKAALPADLESFAEDLVAVCRFESKAMETFNEGKELEAADDFDAAREKYGEVPERSLYHNFVEARILACSGGMFGRLKTRAETSAREEKWRDAVDAAIEALRIQEDKSLSSQITSWRESARIQEEIDVASRRSRATDLNSLQRARMGLDQLMKTSPKHPLVERQVPPMIQALDRRIFMARFATMYRVGDAEGLEREFKKPEADQARVRGIMEKYRKVKKDMAAAADLVKAKKYWEARDKWSDVLRIEPDTQNAFNRRAAAKLAEWSTDKLGEGELDAALDAFRAEKFAEARKRLSLAKEKCNIDVAKEVDAIRKRGKKLYNEGINLILQGYRWDGKQKLLKALECFLPDDDPEWYGRVQARLDKEFP